MTTGISMGLNVLNEATSADGITNEDWQNITFNSFDKTYNVDADIVAMLHSLSKMSYPIYIKDINVQDTSTSEDRVETYTVQMEDLNGKRFTVKLYKAKSSMSILYNALAHFNTTSSPQKKTY